MPPPPGLDAQIEELVMRCLEKLPEDRPQDAMALVKAVQRIERRLSVGAESEASPFVTLPPTATAGAPIAPPSPITGNEPTIAAPTHLSGAAPVPPSQAASTDSVLAAALPQPSGRRGVVAVVGVLALAAVGAALALRSSPSAPDALDTGAVTAIATPPPASGVPPRRGVGHAYHGRRRPNRRGAEAGRRGHADLRRRAPRDGRGARRRRAEAQGPAPLARPATPPRRDGDPRADARADVAPDRLAQAPARPVLSPPFGCEAGARRAPWTGTHGRSPCVGSPPCSPWPRRR